METKDDFYKAETLSGSWLPSKGVAIAIQMALPPTPEWGSTAFPTNWLPLQWQLHWHKVQEVTVQKPLTLAYYPLYLTCLLCNPQEASWNKKKVKEQQQEQ